AGWGRAPPSLRPGQRPEVRPVTLPGSGVRPASPRRRIEDHAVRWVMYGRDPVATAEPRWHSRGGRLPRGGPPEHQAEGQAAEADEGERRSMAQHGGSPWSRGRGVTTPADLTRARWRGGPATLSRPSARATTTASSPGRARTAG